MGMGVAVCFPSHVLTGFGLVFWFGLFCICCWHGECEVLTLKLCWDGWDGANVHVGRMLATTSFVSMNRITVRIFLF